MLLLLVGCVKLVSSRVDVKASIQSLVTWVTENVNPDVGFSSSVNLVLALIGSLRLLG